MEKGQDIVSYLSVEQLSITFGGLRAVDNVTFALQEGQIHGLIGPNGAGKTTIFNCITGFYHPASGTIRFRDQDITHLRPYQIARRGIARTFQNVQLFRTMSVLDNVLVAKHSHMRTGVVAEALALPFVHQQERMAREQAAELRTFRDIATLRSIPVERPPDAPTDYAGGSEKAAEIGMGRLSKRLSDAAQPG